MIFYIYLNIKLSKFSLTLNNMKYLTLVSLQNQTIFVRKICRFSYVGCKNKLCKFAHNVDDIIVECDPNKCKTNCKFYHTTDLDYKHDLNLLLFPHMLNLLLDCYLNFPFMNFTISKNYIYKFNPATISDILQLYTKLQYFPYISDCLEIPKLKRKNTDIYSYTDSPRSDIFKQKVLIDESNDETNENPGPHDGADKSLYSPKQQFKWFFMNDTQKRDMLNNELSNYIKN